MDTIIANNFSSYESEPRLALGNFTISKHTTYVNMYDIDNIIIDEDITIVNNQNDTDFLYIVINQNQSDLSISDYDNNQLSFEEISETELHINLKSNLTQGNHITISLHYKLDIVLDSVSGKPRYYIFPYTQYFTYFTNQYTLHVKLPSGCFLHYPLDCFPDYNSTDTSRNRLFITWEDENLGSVSFSDYIIFFDEAPKPRNIWGYVVGPLIGLIAGASAVYLWMKRGSTRLEEEIEQIYLTKNQQLLLKLIEEKQGKITQQQLIVITNFSKSKVSRNLTPLEENGLVEKEKWGREYKVSLTKKGLKVAKKIVAEELQNLEKLNQTDISKEEGTM